jgi:hypothetical protein
MIKTIENIKLKHLARMERTGNIRQLLAWWNIFPLFLFKNKLIGLVQECYSLINDGKSDDNSYYEFEQIEWKTKSALKIQELETSYMMCILYIDLVVRFDHALKNFNLNRGQRRRIKSLDLALLGKAIEKIKVLTGIAIENKENLFEVQKELIWLKDKFAENFNNPESPESEQKKVTILDYALSMVLYAGGSGDNLDEMKLPVFISFRNRANAKYEAEQKQISEIENRNK